MITRVIFDSVQTLLEGTEHEYWEKHELEKIKNGLISYKSGGYYVGEYLPSGRNDSEGVRHG